MKNFIFLFTMWLGTVVAVISFWVWLGTLLIWKIFALTESEIKNIDERYWAFAVPV